MNQQLLPPMEPYDGVLYWQGFYWAVVGGALYGGYLRHAGALVRLSQEREKQNRLQRIYPS